MEKGIIRVLLAGLFQILVIFGLFNLGGVLHGCGEEETTPSDAEFEVGLADINICKTDFDCPTGYICDKANHKCVKYGDDVFPDAITDITDIKDVADIQDIMPDGIEDVGGDVITDVEVSPKSVTIYDIQDENSENHPAVGTYVVIGGVVATSQKFVVSKSSGLNGFFVQDKNGGAYSGILLVGKQDVIGDNLEVEIGHQYDVWGYYREFKGENDTYSLSQIEVTQILLMQKGQKIPDPVKIADPSTIATGGSQSEMYQGVLVELNGVSVIKEANTYGEWTVTGNLLVDDIFYSYKPSVGTRLSRLVGILHTTFNDYKLEPRDENDIEVEQTDGGVDVLPDVIEDTGVVVKEVTIYDIQNTSSPNHPAENEPIIVKNVVVTAPTHSASSSLNGIFAQEKNGGEYSGILVVYPKSSGLGPFDIGDEITIEGSYKEYNDLSEIVATNIIKVGTTTVPAPAVVNPADVATGGAKSESYEGVLIKVENVEVINENPDAPNDYKEFMVTGNLRVNDLYPYDYTAKRRVGDRFNYIIGVLNYTFGNFKLEPRGNADLSLVVVGPDAGEDVSTQDVTEDVVQDVTTDTVISDAGQDAESDAGQDTGTQPGCDNIAKHIVISEVATRGQTAYDEFVELYNPLNGDVDVSGWKLQYKSATGTTWNDRLTLPAGTVIKAHSYLLLAADSADYNGPTPDFKFAATGIADNGHIRIIDSSGAEVDKLGFNTTDPEGSPAPVTCTTSPCTRSAERKARATSTDQTMASGGSDELAGNGYDSDNNANDFYIRAVRNPQNSQSPAEDHGCFDCQPTGVEICDGKDNDCNGLTDAEDPNLKLDCELLLGVCAGAKHSANQCVNGGWIRACNATEYGADYSVNELCDGLDNNCDGQTDEVFGNLGQACTNGIGECTRSGVYVCKADKSGTECDAVPGNPASEVCDGKDNDCNGIIDDENAEDCKKYYKDLDNDGYGSNDFRCLCSPYGSYTALLGGDCDDNNKDINPNALEVCDGKDNDCDGATDDGEMRPNCQEFYYDADGDTYYSTGAAVKCLCQADTINKFTGVNPGDCDDDNNHIFPGNAEIVDGFDNDCDGRTSEGQYHATWGNIQWADKGVPSMSIAVAENTGNIYGRVYAAGITDVSGDPGQIDVQFGIFPDGEPISIKWFGNATHNPLCSSCGNNYEYMIDLNAQDFIISGKSVYRYVFRYSSDGGANWIYGGYQDKVFKRFEEYDFQYAGTINITGCVPSGEEVCDGIDNDCNGLTDAEDPNLKLDCELRLGVCSGAKHTPNQCVNGGWIRACDATEYGADYSVNELCDGLDNNCDGQTDEVFGNLGQACTNGIGECTRSGVYVCKADKSGTECDAVPGNPASEVCDGKDNDCNGITDDENALNCTNFYFDEDGDAYYALGADYKCLCNPDMANRYTGVTPGDCNDNDYQMNPGLPEVCDGKDNNCNGLTDEEYAQGCSTFYRDEDGDTYGVPNDTKCLCHPAGFYTALRGDDCDDNDVLRNPGVAEFCDGKDNDCDNLTDEAGALGCNIYYFDGDGDTFGVANDSYCLCHPTGKYTAIKDGDCDDTKAFVYPAAPELCNGIDDNCNGVTDEENAQGCTIYYYDNDGDLYYAPGAPSKCLCSSGAINKYTGTTAYDCDDSNSDINPSRVEVIGNNTDDDCDGTSDENPTYTIEWCNTQWPFTRDINWGEPTGDIYGRVYVDGLTNASGDPNLIMAKLVIAPADFTSFSEFRFFPASYNAACSDCGNNYEYMANVSFADYYIPGKYEYVYGFAFSVDGGINWVYGATDNTFYKSWIYIDRAKLGKLYILNHIVISEFMVAGADADDEFIEWYNPTSQPINLKNYRLKYSASGTAPNCTTTPYYTITTDFYIPAKGYVLFARSGKTYSDLADFIEGIALSATAGHLAICDPSNNIIDKVGYGSAAVSPEGSYGPVPPANKSVERKARSSSTSDTMKIGGVDEFLGNGYDSDDNSQDFVLRDIPQPQNSSSPSEP